MVQVSESKAYGGRWSEYVLDGWQDAEVLYEAGEADYQGSAEVLAVQRTSWDGDKYIYASWSWGSCSGCDGWEDLPDAQVRAEATKCTLVMDKPLLAAWRDMLWLANKHGYTDGLIKAINKELES